MPTYGEDLESVPETVIDGFSTAAAIVEAPLGCPGPSLNPQGDLCTEPFEGANDFIKDKVSKCFANDEFLKCPQIQEWMGMNDEQRRSSTGRNHRNLIIKMIAGLEKYIDEHKHESCVPNLRDLKQTLCFLKGNLDEIKVKQYGSQKYLMINSPSNPKLEMAIDIKRGKANPSAIRVTLKGKDPREAFNTVGNIYPHKRFVSFDNPKKTFNIQEHGEHEIGEEGFTFGPTHRIPFTAVGSKISYCEGFRYLDGVLKLSKKQLGEGWKPDLANTFDAEAFRSGFLEGAQMGAYNVQDAGKGLYEGLVGLINLALDNPVPDPEGLNQCPPPDQDKKCSGMMQLLLEKLGDEAHKVFTQCDQNICKPYSRLKCLTVGGPGMQVVYTGCIGTKLATKFGEAVYQKILKCASNYNEASKCFAAIGVNALSTAVGLSATKGLGVLGEATKARIAAANISENSAKWLTRATTGFQGGSLFAADAAFIQLPTDPSLLLKLKDKARKLLQKPGIPDDVAKRVEAVASAIDEQLDKAVDQAKKSVATTETPDVAPSKPDSHSSPEVNDSVTLSATEKARKRQIAEEHRARQAETKRKAQESSAITEKRNKELERAADKAKKEKPDFDKRRLEKLSEDELIARSVHDNLKELKHTKIGKYQIVNGELKFKTKNGITLVTDVSKLDKEGIKFLKKAIKNYDNPKKTLTKIMKLDHKISRLDDSIRKKKDLLLETTNPKKVKKLEAEIEAEVKLLTKYSDEMGDLKSQMETITLLQKGYLESLDVVGTDMLNKGKKIRPWSDNRQVFVVKTNKDVHLCRGGRNTTVGQFFNLCNKDQYKDAIEVAQSNALDQHATDIVIKVKIPAGQQLAVGNIGAHYDAKGDARTIAQNLSPKEVAFLKKEIDLNTEKLAKATTKAEKDKLLEMIKLDEKALDAGWVPIGKGGDVQFQTVVTNDKYAPGHPDQAGSKYIDAGRDLTETFEVERWVHHMRFDGHNNAQIKIRQIAIDGAPVEKLSSAEKAIKVEKLQRLKKKLIKERGEKIPEELNSDIEKHAAKLSEQNKSATNEVFNTKDVQQALEDRYKKEKNYLIDEIDEQIERLGGPKAKTSRIEPRFTGNPKSYEIYEKGSKKYRDAKYSDYKKHIVPMNEEFTKINRMTIKDMKARRAELSKLKNSSKDLTQKMNYTTIILYIDNSLKGL